jgi:hypothetical protein
MYSPLINVSAVFSFDVKLVTCVALACDEGSIKHIFLEFLPKHGFFPVISFASRLVQFKFTVQRASQAGWPGGPGPQCPDGPNRQPECTLPTATKDFRIAAKKLTDSGAMLPFSVQLDVA